MRSRRASPRDLHTGSINNARWPEHVARMTAGSCTASMKSAIVGAVMTMEPLVDGSSSRSLGRTVGLNNELVVPHWCNAHGGSGGEVRYHNVNVDELAGRYSDCDAS